jgi:hypothetical protein
MVPVLQFAASFSLATVALALNTTGFDFYVHAESMMSWHYIPQRNSFWALPGGLKFPRYLSGHHILYLLTGGFVPLAWVVVTMHAALLVACIRRLESLAWYLMPLLGLFFAYNFIFMSMTGIGVSFLLLAVLSRRTGRVWWPWLFLGAAFHPVALVLAIILGVVFLPWVKSALVLLSVVLFSHLLAMSYSESAIGLRQPFDGLHLQANLASALISRLRLFFKIFGIGVIGYGIFHVGRRWIRIPRFPIPGALMVAAVLIAGAAVIGWQDQFQRGSLISYIWDRGNQTLVQSDKNQLICAAWVSRVCYQGLGDERGFGFRQEQLP